ncbi:MAG: rod shape-determining protein MreD [Methylococcaceae bacterium]|nr:rod shape-determining protein MreD [Methylococcaceae bacterium]
MLNNHQNLVLTIALAMCFKIAPFPHAIRNLNPDWILLVLIYWSLALPYQQGVFNAWAIGLLTDVLTGRSLGEHALIYALVIYVCIKLHKRLRQFPLLQQTAFILVCLLVAQIIVFWVESMRGPARFSTSFWLPVLTGTLFWPFVNPVINFIRSLGKSG